MIFNKNNFWSLNYLLSIIIIISYLKPYNCKQMIIITEK